MIRFSKQTMGLLFRVWVLIAISLTIVCGMVYVGIQQLNRLSINETISQIAYDVAYSLQNNQESNLSLPVIDIQKSLSPFVILFDSNNQPIQTNAKLGESKPLPPVEILDFAKKFGESRVTWQPIKGLRFATVTVYFKNIKTGFVLVGRSLFEVENRINKIGRLLVTIWLFSLLITFLTVFLLSIHYKGIEEEPLSS